MPPALALYITKYGYLAVFSLVFLQELGVPNPVPTEFIILFSGYLSSIGVLSFPVIFLVAVLGDFIGTTALYTIFYFFGEYILAHKPAWLPISREKIDKLSQRIAKKERWGIYIGRLLPYLRGYTSVAAGLLQIKPKIFLPAVIIPAIIWSGGYALLGRILGRYWEGVGSTIDSVGKVVALAICALVIYFLGRYLMKLRKRSQKAINYEDS